MDADRIRAKLHSLDTITDLRSLFIEDLNYEYRDQFLSPRDLLSEGVRQSVQEIQIIAGYADFTVILCTLDRLLKPAERPIAKQLMDAYFHSLFVFTDIEREEWHFCNLKHVEREGGQQEAIARRVRPFRRMVAGKTERLRTISEQLAKTAVQAKDSGLLIHQKMDAAFDVEAVSRNFYKDFVHYYKQFRDALQDENNLKQKQADHFTQTIFNRLLFLYYVQKRGFLDANPRYLYEQFQNCSSHTNYYQTYLIPLFKRLSDQTYEAPALGDVPFLNGGLFEFSSDEEELAVRNSWFKPVYQDLLERYNFTVREDTEFEQEVAIDPEMLGTVFEQLILGLESKEFKDIPDPRRGTGSYYTPKFIVAFMVKESLLAYIEEQFPHMPHQAVKKLVYNLDLGDLSKGRLKHIRNALMGLKVIDPGVGSGAFPVGLLLKMVEIIEAIDRTLAPDKSEEPDYRYRLKRDLIEKTIYGVDIQPRATHLAELRLWLSLLVEVPEPEPLPNLDLHIMTGNSLVSKIGGVIDFDLERQVQLNADGKSLIGRFQRLKGEYEGIYDRDKKREYRQKVKDTKQEIIRWFLEKRQSEIEERAPQLALMDEKKEEARQKQKRYERELRQIQHLLNDVDELTKTFNWGLDFAEIMTLNGGFDIVIGNPPYGVSVTHKVKKEFKLGNRDSYGVFTALGLRILRPHGTLCYIMSDTWQTIGTHRELRDLLLTATDIRHLISVPNDTFKATVNPGVYFFQKRAPSDFKSTDDNWVLASDFSPLSIKAGDLEVAFEILAEVNRETLDKTKDGLTLWSDRKMAVFAYRQKLIPRFSNQSFFIASPKLFRLMRDVDNRKANPWAQPRQASFIAKPEQASFFQDTDGPPVHTVDFNGKELELIKLGDVADVVVGLQTGDNNHYLRQSQERLEGASRNYDVVDFDLVVEDGCLESIADTEALRLAIIQAGFVKDLDAPQCGILTVCFEEDRVEIYEGDVTDSGGEKSLLGTYEKRTNIEIPETDTIIHPKDRFFEGRHFVPYDKGGASDIDQGWLPNYYVPTDYFIDWSEGAIERLRTLTIADRIRLYNENKEIKPHYETTTCAVLRNTGYYFREGISYSRTGEYCPTFRINSPGPFDTEGSTIFSQLDTTELLGILPSTLCRYLFKNFIDHTVHLQVADVKRMPMCLQLDPKVKKVTQSIIDKQKENPRYNYMNNEQAELNHIVYRMYNLNEEDIGEVENWFWRRYPKLAKAIEANQNN